MTVRSSAWLLAALALLPQTRAAEASPSRQVLVTSADHGLAQPDLASAPAALNAALQG